MQRAVQKAHIRKPYVLKGPHILERVFKWESQADTAAQDKSVERLDAYRVRWHGKAIEDFKL